MTNVKAVLSLEDQLTHLENNKNLIIRDQDYARSMLEQIGYFALISGYKAPFKNPTTKNRLRFSLFIKFQSPLCFAMFFSETLILQRFSEYLSSF